MKSKLLFFILLISNTLLAQQKPELTGQVKDGKTKDNLEFCSVGPAQYRSSLITGGLTQGKAFLPLRCMREAITWWCT